MILLSTRILLASLLTWAGASPATAAGEPVDGMAEIRDKYATAAYEEALTLLTRVDDPSLSPEVDELRTLCLLALGHHAEARQAMETIVRRHPLALERLEVRSPKFVSLYLEVRSRLGPTLAAESYVTAKRTYDTGNLVAAVAQFRETVALTRAFGEDAAVSDLGLLAVGFLALAEDRAQEAAHRVVALAEPAMLRYVGADGLAALLRDDAVEAAPDGVVPPGTALASAAPATLIDTSRGSGVPSEPAPFMPVPRLYGPEDEDVRPPAVIEQRLPAWRPPLPAFAARTYTGRVQVIVDTDGRVSDVEILQQSHSLYDREVLDAAKLWRYEPATKRGYPVQYRRVIDYVLSPRPNGSR
ncbi:MAG: TonB family protein [Vicinamibacterales bacterium]